MWEAQVGHELRLDRVTWLRPLFNKRKGAVVQTRAFNPQHKIECGGSVWSWHLGAGGQEDQAFKTILSYIGRLLPA